MKPVDNAILETMRSYLRTSSSGGMPKKQCDKILAAVEDAARLGYFTIGVSEHATAMLKCLERNSDHSHD